MDVLPITYRGPTLAACTPPDVLCDELDALPDTPLTGFVVAMCLYAGAILNGDLPGPYARAYAPAWLVPGELRERPRDMWTTSSCRTDWVCPSASSRSRCATAGARSGICPPPGLRAARLAGMSAGSARESKAPPHAAAAVLTRSARWTPAAGGGDTIIAGLTDWTQAFGRPPRECEWSSTPTGPGRGPARWRDEHPRWRSTGTVVHHFRAGTIAMRAAGLRVQTAEDELPLAERVASA
jgi:hypothetical protein